MWKEFEGKWEWSNGKKVLKIEEKDMVPVGNTLVIGRETTQGFRKKIVCETSVTILDDSRVKVTKKRPLESTVTNAGNVNQMGIALQAYSIEKGKTIPEESTVYQGGQIWETSGNSVHGVLYIDQQGTQPKAVLTAQHRTFYKTDNDKEALKLFKRFKIR